MRKLHYGIVVLTMLIFCSVRPVSAQISIGIGLPHVSIGINLPLYPELVPVPGYPVYYAPQVAANYFFYDGLYWVFWHDDWYASEWYNGPWWLVEPEIVPLYILRVPVRYYRYPPPYFRGWRHNAPPRWGQYWGREWEHHRKGWNKWDRRHVPARAPLPVYQRNYTGDRYPRQMEEQRTLRHEHYRYQPRTRAIRQHFQQPGDRGVTAPVQRQRQAPPGMRAPRQQMEQRVPAPMQRQQREERRIRTPAQIPPTQQRSPQFKGQGPQPGAIQQAPRPQRQEQRYQYREKTQEPSRGREQRQEREEYRGR